MNGLEISDWAGPLPLLDVIKKKIVFLRQLPKRLTSGVETHQACPIVTMSPQGFSGSPYLPWDMVWYVTRIHILFETLPRPECSREEKEKIRSNKGREPSWHDQYYGSAVNLKIPDILPETLVVCKSFISTVFSISVKLSENLASPDEWPCWVFTFEVSILKCDNFFGLPD